MGKRSVANWLSTNITACIDTSTALNSIFILATLNVEKLLSTLYNNTLVHHIQHAVTTKGMATAHGTMLSGALQHEPPCYRHFTLRRKQINPSDTLPRTSKRGSFNTRLSNFFASLQCFINKTKNTDLTIPYLHIYH